MSETKSIRFSENDIFDSSKLEIVEAQVKLKKIVSGTPATYVDDFSSPTGKSFDSNKIEITGGVAQLKTVNSNVTKSIAFSTSENKTFNSNLIEFTGAEAKLKDVSQSGQEFKQDFSNSAGFTFNAARTEFNAGQVQQVDQRPADATFFANYDSSLDGNWADGALTGTPIGGASVTGGNLDLKGATIQYVDYDASLNASSQQTGTIRMLWKPNYNTKPANNNILFSINAAAANDNNKIELVHDQKNGEIKFTIKDSAGANIVNNANLGVLATVLGQTYEVELNYDITAGATRVFIDGVQQGATQLGTGVRDTNISLFRVGSNEVAGEAANFEAEDLLVFSSVQHTANYTAPSITPSGTLFSTDVITLPTFSYSGLTELLSFDAFAAVQVGLSRYVLNDLYWDGAAWTATSNTYATAASAVDTNSNIASLPVSDTITVKIITDSTNIQESVSELIVTYTDKPYVSSNPEIIYTKNINSTANPTVISWLAFVESIAAVGDDRIKYVLSDDNGITYKYYDGGGWVVSVGFAESNIGSELSTNITTFPVTTDGIILKAFLHSENGLTTPTISNVNITFEDNAYSLNSPTINYSDNNIENLVDGLFGITAFIETATVTGSDEIRYIFSTDGGFSFQYLSNGLWITSNGSFLQSNTAAEISAAISSLDVSGDKLKIRIFLNSSDGSTTPQLDQIQLNYDTNVSSYPTDSPSIQSVVRLDAASLDGFSESSTKPLNTEIKYIMLDGDNKKYHDGTNWVSSSGDVSESNLATEIDANRSTLAITGSLGVIAFLISTDGMETPIL